MRRSTTGYAALHKPQLAGTAASPSTYKHSHSQGPKQHPSRESLRHQSGRKQQCSAEDSCSHNTKGASDGPDEQTDTRVSPHKGCTQPRPGKTGASPSPGKSSPNKVVVSPSKVQSKHAAGCPPQPISAHGNAQPAAPAHASRQQKRHHKHSSSASPTHMQNWVRWESDKDKVRNLNLLAETQSANSSQGSLMIWQLHYCHCCALSASSILLDELQFHSMDRQQHDRTMINCLYFVLVQADVGPSGKGRVAATAFPSNAMAQATGQPAADCQSVARDQVTGSNKRHVMPCSGHSPSRQLPQARQGVPTQPLFSAPQGSTPLRGGPEVVVDKGLRVDSGSDSRVAGVRYCLSSSEPAVGAGIWEEQTTRHADLPA